MEAIIGTYALNAGDNTIDFASGDGYICFRQLCTGTPPPSNCTGLGDVCSGNPSEIRSYTINMSAGGSKQFKLTYKAHEGPSTGRMRINGGAWQTFGLVQTNIGQYVEATIGSYSLNAGNNTVEFASGGGYICFRQLCTGNTGTRISIGENSIEQQADDEVSVSPNPNDGKFDLRFYIEPGKTAVLTILSQAGTELLSKRFVGHGEHLEHIQRDSSAAGIFLVQLRTNDRIRTKKIIIVR